MDGRVTGRGSAESDHAHSAMVRATDRTSVQISGPTDLEASFSHPGGAQAWDRQGRRTHRSPAVAAPGCWSSRHGSGEDCVKSRESVAGQTAQTGGSSGEDEQDRCDRSCTTGAAPAAQSVSVATNRHACQGSIRHTACVAHSDGVDPPASSSAGRAFRHGGAPERLRAPRRCGFR